MSKLDSNVQNLVSSEPFMQIKKLIQMGKSPVSLAEEHDISLLEVVNQTSVVDHFELSERLLRNRIKRGKMKITSEGMEKQCTGCLEYWPLTPEFFPRNNRAKDSAHTLCKMCEGRRAKAKRAKKSGYDSLDFNSREDSTANKTYQEFAYDELIASTADLFNKVFH